MEKCRKRAREVMYWPGINNEITDMVTNCGTCAKYRSAQQAEPLKQHAMVNRPWEKICADLFVLDGKNYLVMTDYFSNYPEVSALPSTNAASVINVMKSVFARHGIPNEVFSDNGPQFASAEFERFAKNWDFVHTTSSPMFPQSNGRAEKSVQTVKNIMKKSKDAGEDHYIGLLAYRTTPLECGKSPAELLMGRRVRSNLPISNKLLKIGGSKRVRKLKERSRNRQKFYHDRTARELSPLRTGDSVRIHNGKMWSLEGRVRDCVAPRSYVVETSAGSEYRRNRRDLLKTKTHENYREYNDSGRDENKLENSASENPIEIHSSPEISLETNTQISSAPGLNNLSTRSGRVVKKPERLIEQV